MKRTKTFNIGDKVFAKVKGYPAWPAKIVAANGRKYEVIFYGTGETGLIKIEDLFYYLKHKEQFCKNLKRKDYIEALEQIEAEIRESGTDGNPGDDTVNDNPQEKPEKTKGRKRKRSGSNSDSRKSTQSSNESTVAEESENSLPESSSIDDSNEANKTIPPPLSRSGRAIKSKRFSPDIEEEEKPTSKRRKSVPEGSQSTGDQSKSPRPEPIIENEEVTSTADANEFSKDQNEKNDTEKNENQVVEINESNEEKEDQKKDHTDKVTVGNASEKILDQQDLNVETYEEDYAGDKKVAIKEEIKMKEDENAVNEELNENEKETDENDMKEDAKMEINNDPIEVSVISTEYLNTVVAYAEHVKANAKKFKNQPEEARTKSKNEVVLVTLPSGKMVGLKYGTNSSKSTSEYDKALSDEEDAKTLYSLKELVEKGNCKPEDYSNMFIVNIKVPEDQDTKTIEMTKIKLNLIKIEATLVDYDTKIKASLGLDRAEPKKALEYLDLMAELSITPVMLKKHPLIVDMVKRLKRYVGNAKEWNLPGNALEEFQSDAKRIRTKAEEIFMKFKSLFAVPDNMSFWDIFNGAVEQFKEDTKDMKENDVFALCAEPFSRQAFFDSHDIKIEIECPIKEEAFEKENCSNIPNSGSTEEGNTVGLS